MRESNFREFQRVLCKFHNYEHQRLERRGSSTSLSISLLLPPSNTSLIILHLRQLIIQILGGMIIGIGAFKPLREMVVVVLLRFLLAERLHHTFLFCIRKHQVHAGGKGCLVLIITDDMESISHQTPYYVPFMLRINVDLNPILQLIIKKERRRYP